MLSISMDKYLVMFSRVVSGSDVVFKKKRVKPEQVKDGISYKGRTHFLDLAKPIYRDRSKFIYLVDVQEGQKSTLNATYPVSAKLLDAVLRKEIAKQLVAGLGGSDWTLAIIIGLICAVTGVMSGIVLGQFIDFPGV